MPASEIALVWRRAKNLECWTAIEFAERCAHFLLVPGFVHAVAQTAQPALPRMLRPLPWTASASVPVGRPRRFPDALAAHADPPRPASIGHASVASLCRFREPSDFPSDASSLEREHRGN